MSQFIATAALLLALSGQAVSAERDLLLIKEFNQLSPAQQTKIFSASLLSATFILFFDNAQSMKSLPRTGALSACLMDRDAAWLKHAYDDYKLTREINDDEAAGAVFAKAIAWKCGYP